MNMYLAKKMKVGDKVRFSKSGYWNSRRARRGGCNCDICKKLLSSKGIAIEEIYINSNEISFIIDGEHYSSRGLEKAE